MSDGRHTATRLRTKVEIEFATVTDVTADVVSVEVKRGRSSEQDTTGPGTARIVLQDTDGRYDPTLNEALVDPVTSATWSGPNAPYVTPGRAVSIRVSDIGSVVEGLRPDRYFELAEPSGTVAFDRGATSGTAPSVAADGSYVGSTWGSGPSRLFSPHLLEQDQQAPVFPGNGHYVTSTTTVPAQDLALPRSYLMWAYRDAGSDGYLFSVDQQVRVSVGTDAKLTVDLWVDDDGTDGWASFTADDFTMEPGVWYLVGLVSDPHDQAGWRLYIDGEFVAGATGTTAAVVPADAPLLIGAFDPTGQPEKCWAGGIKDVAVWYDKAITRTQMERLAIMSAEGFPWFTGRALSWDVRAPEVPFGRSEVTVQCVDVANELLQNEVEIDVRSALLAANPTQLFTLDTEEGEDAQGGRKLTVQGAIQVISYRDSQASLQYAIVVPTAGSVTTGVSFGAFQFPSVTNVFSGRLIIPPPTDTSRSLNSFCFWIRLQQAPPPVSLDVIVTNFPTAPSWQLAVSSTGMLEARVGFATYTSNTLLTNDTWRLVWVDVDADSDETHIYVDNTLALTVDGQWAGNVTHFQGFGNAISVTAPTGTVGYDEIATWYAPDTAPAHNSPERNLVYEAAGRLFERQTTRERVDTILQYAGYSGATDLSDQASTLCNKLTPGNTWTLLQQTAQTEAGTVDVAGDGTVRFRSRFDRRWFGASTAATEDVPASGVSDVSFVTDDRYLYNSVRVDNATFVEDATSIGEYGRRSLNVTPNLFSANERVVRAQGLVELYKDYRPRSDRLRWDLNSSFGGAGLIVDVNDLVTISRLLFSTNVNAEYKTDVWVEQLTLSVNGESKQGTVTAEVSPVDPRQNDYWQLDRSLLNGNDVLGW